MPRRPTPAADGTPPTRARVPAVAGQVPAVAGPAPAALARAQGAARTEITRLHEELAALRVTRASVSDDDEHDPDGAPLSGEWSRLEGLLRAEEAGLADIDAALARVAAGTYGTCLRCGGPIAPARLEARPAAALCITCAAAGP